MVAKKKAVQSREDMDRFILSNLRVGMIPEPSEAAIDDLRYFETKASEGSAIRFDALATWMFKNHGIKIGKAGMHTLCTKNGITPWWSR